MAVETIITFMIGITVAIGVITLFSSYRAGIIETVETQEETIIKSEIENSIFQLKNTDSGHTSVDLPEELAGQDYTVTLSAGEVHISRVGTRESTPIIYEGEFEGSSDRDARVFKNPGEQYILRED